MKKVIVFLICMLMAACGGDPVTKQQLEEGIEMCKNYGGLHSFSKDRKSVTCRYGFFWLKLDAKTSQ